MVTEEDKRGLRIARSELNKRCVDCSLADVRMAHGVLHIRGTVQKGPGASFSDIHLEMEHIIHALRTKPEIRDVSLEVTYR